MLSLGVVKNYLNRTYEDVDVDRKVSGIMLRGVSYIRRYVGIDKFPEKELTAEEEQLVLDYCRYVDNNAFEDFENNFLSELQTARDNRHIEAYREANSESEEEEETEDGGEIQ